MMKTSTLIISLFALVFISCEKQEKPIIAPPPGDVIIQQVEMGGDYRNQLFFSLSENTVVSQNLYSIWDLSFESADEGYHVLINSSCGSKVAFFPGATMDEDLNPDNAAWKYDASSGNLDSTAIGDWRAMEGIHLIDRGYNHTGVSLGYAKIKVLDANVNTFTFEYAVGNNVQEYTLTKNKSLNFTQFSFDSQTISITPDKDSWDLLFTQYTYVFTEFEEIIPYLVRGALLNRNSVEAVIHTKVPFDEIDLDYASNLELNKSLEAIGYTWKYYSFDEGYYAVLSDQTYILKNVEGLYYKIRFTDFYTETGEKGAPMFEFQKL